jgi:polyisoprenoid-binding protein YceI
MVRITPRTWLVAAAAAIVLGGIAFGAVYLAMFNPRSVARVALPSATPVPQDSTASAGLGASWKVSGGFVGYRVREQLASLPAPSDAVGRTTAVTGSATVAGNPDGSATVTALNVSADVSQLQSDSSRRDNYIRGNYLETGRFPTATFQLAGPVTIPPDIVAGAAGKVVLRGTFTIHGVSMQVPMTLSLQRSGTSVNIVASYQFEWGQYGVNRPSTPFATVQSNPTIELSLVLSPA